MKLPSALGKKSLFIFTEEFLRFKSANIIQCLFQRVSDQFNILRWASCQDNFFKHIDTVRDLIHLSFIYLSKTKRQKKTKILCSIFGLRSRLTTMPSSSKQSAFSCFTPTSFTHIITDITNTKHFFVFCHCKGT